MKIAVINGKGGTGKTTTTINLGAALAEQRQRVLVIDMDSQANASLALGIPFPDLSPSILHALARENNLLSLVRKTKVRGLDLIPAETELASTDLILAEEESREFRLKELLSPLENLYDTILIDCPPAVSLLSINALAAVDSFLVPVAPDYLSLEGLISILGTIETVKTNMCLPLQCAGIVFSLVRKRRFAHSGKELKMQREIIHLIEDQYPEMILNTRLYYRPEIAESHFQGQSLMENRPRSTGAGLYRNLAKEILVNENFSAN